MLLRHQRLGEAELGTCGVAFEVFAEMKQRGLNLLLSRAMLSSAFAKKTKQVEKALLSLY